MEEKKNIIATVNEPVTNCDQLAVVDIQSLIREVRGTQVMLDSDLARLYGVETKRLNEQVKRNIERFPKDFMFQLTAEECSRSQIATLNTKRGQNIKYLPYAFTEQGVSMLSGVLRSPIAIEVNIRIMRAFVAMRHVFANSSQIFNRLETLEHNQLLLHQHQSESDQRIEQVLELMEKNSEKPQQGIFFDGQIYDSYTFVSDLIRSAEHRIVLIDNYIDDTVLTMMDKRNEGVGARLYAASISNQLRLDLERHNAQYPRVEIGIYRQAHDRFLIIDDTIYHIGASIKDLGKKLFAFSVQKVMTATELLTKIGVE